MQGKHYLVLDREDPGSEHDTWEQAAQVLKECEAKYGRQLDARIISPDHTQYHGW